MKVSTSRPTPVDTAHAVSACEGDDEENIVMTSDGCSRDLCCVHTLSCTTFLASTAHAVPAKKVMKPFLSRAGGVFVIPCRPQEQRL